MTGLRALAVVLAALAASPLARPATAEETDTCVGCHEVDIDEILARPVPEWRESVHAEHAVSCDACHGGDPRQEDAEASMSAEAGFLELPSWQEMDDHCGICHEGIADAWREGRFGRALARGRRVATCATCHMREGHRILAARPEELRTEESCPDCPSVGDPAATIARLREMESREREVEGALAALDRLGMEPADLRADLRAARADLQLALHRFDDDGIEAGSVVAAERHAGLAVRADALVVRANAQRRLGFGVLGALALLFVAVWLAGRSARGRG